MQLRSKEKPTNVLQNVMAGNGDADARDDGQGSDGAVAKQLVSKERGEGEREKSQAEREEVDAGFDRRGAVGRLEVHREIVESRKDGDAVNEGSEESDQAGAVGEDVKGDGRMLDEALLDPKEGAHAREPESEGDEDLVGGPRVGNTSPSETEDRSCGASDKDDVAV